MSAVIPRATYRLQLHGGFGFDAAAAVVPYLARLGISHVYCSPILRARPGSMHGYDVVAHDEINPELGGAEGHARFAAALRAHGMGAILDLVPNHMGISPDNAWWADVLEHGRASRYAGYFDIDWEPSNPDLRQRLLTPMLGEHYDDALRAGLLRVAFDAERGAFELRYHEHRWPIDLASLAPLLREVAATTARTPLDRLANAIAQLPPRTPEHLARAARAAALKQQLAQLAMAEPEAASAIDARLAALDADALHALLEAQTYRLTYWRVASDEINYRRFFDINELAALRIEDRAVFDATHRLPIALAAAGDVQGLRIDHPDGLCDPAGYFERLQQAYADASGGARDGIGLYVIAEKIAAPYEDVPTSWPIHGTTGYRYAMVVGGVLVDTAAEEALDRIWREFSGETASFHELAHAGRLAAARGILASDLTMHATALVRIARADRRTRDYTWNSLRDALAEVAACMPVYRTYVIDRPSEQDLRFIDWAIAQARQRGTGVDPTIFDFVRRCLANDPLPGSDTALRARIRDFAIRFQQFCAPVAAKGVEDTAFYRYHRLVSLNEVGGEPGTFGMTPRAFHGASSDRAARWPHTILATSTHDNKRSEDVRNRISVLSQMPEAWDARLQRWTGLSCGWRTTLADVGEAPSRADEYLLWQTLVGTLPVEGLDADTLPAYRERMRDYMIKAAREAKLQTSWMRPHAAYEQALLGFVDGVLARVQPNPLLTDLRRWTHRIAWYGALNSLTMVLLKLTSPGVPDLYQGSELVELQLVDPDNRRPVDYAVRAALLDELGALQQADPARLAATLAAWCAPPADARLKLWITWRLLALRREYEALFRDGSYQALDASGTSADHVLSYARSASDRTVCVAGVRLHARLAERGADETPAWRDTRLRLPEALRDAPLRNVLTGEALTPEDGAVTAQALFATLPVAALVRAR